METCNEVFLSNEWDPVAYKYSTSILPTSLGSAFSNLVDTVKLVSRVIIQCILFLVHVKVWKIYKWKANYYTSRI